MKEGGDEREKDASEEINEGDSRAALRGGGCWTWGTWYIRERSKANTRRRREQESEERSGIKIHLFQANLGQNLS
jgi:hypothetical protein